MQFRLRPANQTDASAIRRLIFLTRLNPIGLSWPRFVVAVTTTGELMGFGQIKPHSDGSAELASIAVQAQWRKQGVARAIVEHLVRSHQGPLYLTCRASLGAFYAKFGFHRTDEGEMTPYFSRLNRIAWLVRFLRLSREAMWVMKRVGEANASSSAKIAPSDVL